MRPWGICRECWPTIFAFAGAGIGPEGYMGFIILQWEEVREVSKAQVQFSGFPYRREALICAFAREEKCFLVKGIL